MEFKFEVREENGKAICKVTNLVGKTEEFVMPSIKGEPPMEVAWAIFPEVIRRWYDNEEL